MAYRLGGTQSIAYKKVMEEKRISDVETLLAHQEQQIEDLSDMVVAQGREIEALKARLERLSAKLSVVETAVTDGREGLSAAEQAAMDKPPHY